MTSQQNDEVPVGTMCQCTLSQIAKRPNGTKYNVQGDFEPRYKFLGRSGNLWQFEDIEAVVSTEKFLVDSEFIKYFKGVR